MDGLLIVDKPVGPTSHDVVARVRRALGERRIGHTGTLDPMASGVLPLVLGRATRLARFLSATEKTYIAVVRLGMETDSHDADGQPVGDPYDGAMPDPRRDRTRAGQFSRDVSAAAAEVFRQEDRRHPEPRAGEAAARTAFDLAQARALDYARDGAGGQAGQRHRERPAGARRRRDRRRAGADLLGRVLRARAGARSGRAARDRRAPGGAAADAGRRSPPRGRRSRSTRSSAIRRPLRPQ